MDSKSNNIVAIESGIERDWIYFDFSWNFTGPVNLKNNSGQAMLEKFGDFNPIILALSKKWEKRFTTYEIGREVWDCLTSEHGFKRS